jgi:glycosyltransferase involved in cell wall biosynthesis
MSVFIDLTEFLTNPILTGIQRVTAEICRHWPDDELRPIRLAQSGERVELPQALIGAIAACFKVKHGAAVRRVRALGEVEGKKLKLGGLDSILVPEVFYDPKRVAFFRQLPELELERYRFIVYDLMPLLYPKYFAPDIQLDTICGYFSVIRRVQHCGFISEWTQRTYYHRLLRRPTVEGVVLRLGSDGLGAKSGPPREKRPPHFCAIGTIEPRKNHELILNTLEPLLRTRADLRLTFLGRLGWVDPTFRRRLEWLAAGNCPGFEWIADADDQCIRRHVEGARATIYPSAAEGFGLPAVESLWLGTPVIASSVLPSLEAIVPQGVEVVDPLDVSHLEQALLRFLDESFADAKAREARELVLPTWSSFAWQVAEWCA